MSRTLALKAELVLALQLTTRHRAPRLALLLVVSLVGMLLVEQDPQGISVRRHSLVLMAGILSAVAASRQMSRGAALSSARRGAASWWVPPVGRLCGALLFALLPVTAAAGILIVGPAGSGAALPLLAILPLYVGAFGGLVMAATPLVGASAAAATGLLGSLAGGFPPFQLSVFLENWSFIRRPIVGLWNVLPLPWRVTHWVARGGFEDPILFGAWLVAGLCLIGWIATRAPLSQVRRPDA